MTHQDSALSELLAALQTGDGVDLVRELARWALKNRGHFPNYTAVVKLLWLAIRDTEDKRARQRAKDAGKKANERAAPGRLVEGSSVHGRKAALGALSIAYPDRINNRI